MGCIIGSWVIGLIFVLAAEIEYDVPLDTDTGVMVGFYQDPIINAGPYLIGMFFGFLYRDFKNGDKINFYRLLRNNKMISYATFVSGIFVTLLVIYFPSTL